MDTRQESVAPSTVDFERIHKMPECITKGEPKLEAAPPASHGMAQLKCSDCSRTDPLPLGSGRLHPARHDTPAGKPPSEMNICNTSDNLQIEMSVILVKMADGSPPAEVKILTDSDTLQTELSVMTMKSERWMERFIMNPQVLCLDGLTSDDDPEDRSSDVDGEDGVISGSDTYSGIRTTRSYRKVDGPVCRRPGRVSVCFQDECGGPDVRAGRV